MRHLLVTNDFPPKVGGIQSYLWELWRRLPPEEVTVLTAAFTDAATWDADQAFRIERTRHRVLLPTRSLRARVDALAAEVGADLVVLDPALPLGLLGGGLARPYVAVLHGAEVTVPGRLPIGRALLGRVLSGAQGVIAAGRYPLAEAERAAGRGLDAVLVPPGVDTDRFRPLANAARREARERLGFDPAAPVVLGVSRLVPRKGFDVLIRAGHALARDHPDLQLVIVGDGRDRRRLERIAASGPCDVRFLGKVPDADLADVYGCADVFAMLCRNRWWGLEQEGFGIVFLEAASAGVAQVAGWSGGAAEAVSDGVTGTVVREPRDVDVAAAAIADLLVRPEHRATLASAARVRAEQEFSYDVLAARLRDGLRRLGAPGGSA